MTLIGLLVACLVYALIMYIPARVPMDSTAATVIRAAVTIFFVIYLLKATGLIGALGVRV